MRKTLILLSLLALLANGSCNKDNAEPSSSPIINTPQIDNFPNQVGYKWKYLVLINFDTVPDTLKVRIIGTKQLPNGENAKVWLLEYPDGSDTNFVTDINDTIKFYRHPYSVPNQNSLFYVFRTILFPLTVGKGWGGDMDSTSVIAKDTVQTSAGIFTDAINIVTHQWGPNYLYDENNWFVNKIGFVKTHIGLLDLGLGYSESWDLLSYDFGQR
ncbi:MAG: hypothetical protein NTU98_09800 [Bacteroidetes bacterium]|nr:hypothetical protein [Bacteroidota bacterium]